MKQQLMDACLVSAQYITKWVAPILHRAIEGSVVIFVCYLSWEAFHWSFEVGRGAVMEKGAVDIGVAAIIAAVLTPLSTLQGYVLSKYITSRNGENGHNGVSAPVYVQAPQQAPVYQRPAGSQKAEG